MQMTRSALERKRLASKHDASRHRGDVLEWWTWECPECGRQAMEQYRRPLPDARVALVAIDRMPKCNRCLGGDNEWPRKH